MCRSCAELWRWTGRRATVITRRWARRWAACCYLLRSLPLLCWVWWCRLPLLGRCDLLLWLPLLLLWLSLLLLRLLPLLLHGLWLLRPLRRR